jgi:ABC-type branched-subunit amino acid transport system ATPase component/ABC-type branched-subunit amino acid transport system permease subunit
MTRIQIGVAAAALALAVWMLPEFYVTILNYVGLYALVALGIVLLTGVIGVTSFGQAAFVGLSAYTSAVLTLRFGISPIVSLLVCSMVTISAAAIIGLLTLSLSGHYLPLGTIAWGLSAYYALGNVEALGGHTGLDGIPPLSIGSFRIETGREMFVLIWVVSIGATVALSNMLDSRPGRAMRAIKTSRETAESFGVDTPRLRLIAFLYAAFLASVSGWLYAHMLRFLNPSPFSLTMGIEYLFMAVVGGAGQVWGALLGAGIITALREWLQEALPRLVGEAGNFEIIVFGALVIILLQLNGEAGLSSLFLRARARLARKPDTRSICRLPEPTKPKKPDRVGPLLRVENISKSFGGLRAVQNISFSVAQREIVAVIGPNGAGKSTLFNCITGLLSADGGGVWVNGSSAELGRPRSMVRLGLARTFQHVQLVDQMSVIENVMLGGHIHGKRGTIAAALGYGQREEEYLRSDALNQLQRVGLAHLAEVPALSLPLGQQRLVEIARALCAYPDLLLLDEPAAGLRFAEKKELAELLRTLRSEGMSVLLVEHDMEFVMKLCDRIVVMNFGEKLFEGAPEAVRSNESVIEAYLGRNAA